MEAFEIPTQTRLLKANDVRGLGSKVAFNFEDLRQRGDAYLEAVRNQAAELLDEAQAQVESIRQRAHELGREQGANDGLRNAAEKIEERARTISDKTVRENLATLLPGMKAAVDALVIERDHWLQEWESTAVRLAAAIAEKIIHRRLDLNPDLSREMVRSALQLAAGTPQIKLHLHTSDAAALGSRSADVVRAMASCGEAEIIADDSVSPGGCVIESRHGTIDARIETLLDRIVSELLEAKDGI